MSTETSLKDSGSKFKAGDRVIINDVPNSYSGSTSGSTGEVVGFVSNTDIKVKFYVSDLTGNTVYLTAIAYYWVIEEEHLRHLTPLEELL